MPLRLRLPALLALAALAGWAAFAMGSATKSGSARVSRVIDGDTIVLTTGQRVRLVQIDTPEVTGSPECYGEHASTVTKRLLPTGTRVLLYAEPATDAVDSYHRLLRYVVRASDGLNVNVQLVRIGAAAPYFYDHRRGKYASLLERLALSARATHVGLWGHCPHTPYDPNRKVDAY